MFAGDLKRLVEVCCIDPGLSADAIQHTVFPQPRRLDVERGLLLLIAGLDAMAGDRPLSPHPIDVAMKGHGCLRLPNATAAASKSKDTGAHRLRKIEGWFRRINCSVWSLVSRNHCYPTQIGLQHFGHGDR